MVSVFGGGLAAGLLLMPLRLTLHGDSAWQHLIMGGFAFGAVFMATDPVSASQTEK